MKKIFLSLAFIVTSMMGFAENAISLNLGEAVTFQNIELYNIEASMIESNFSLNVEYNHIFDSNFIIGGVAGIGFDGVTLDRKNNDLKYQLTGANISFAPEIGFKLGKKHFYTLLLQPLYFSNLFITKSSAGTDNDSLYDINYKATCTTLKSGFRFNFQWGGVCKNGFYVGAYIPWLRNITDAKLKDVDLKDQTSRDIGFEIAFGYRMSFVF